MEKNNILKTSIWIALLFSTIALHAQKNRYIVHFPDKSDTQYSLTRPLDFLSQKAIDRRIKHNISITEEDFPVSQKYIDSLNNYGLKAYYTSRWFNCALIQTTEEKANEIATKSFVSSVEFVAPNAKLLDQPEIFEGEYVTKAPRYMGNTSEVQLSMLHANIMHEAGYTGAGLWIAVFDGGFLGTDSSLVFKHIYDNNKIIDIEDFISGGTNVFQYQGHGTSVLSCIASNYNTNLIGTAYNADFSLYVVEDAEDEYRIEEYNWLFAAEKADSSGVDIISSSVGYNTFTDTSMNYEITDLNGETAVSTRAANIAFTKGILVVVGAGNLGNDSSWEGKINFPADAKNALAVGAIDSKNIVALFSSRGPTTDNRIKPDLVALGVKPTVLHADGNIRFNSGTSFSVPLIAGFAASVWQYNRDLTNIELLRLLKSAGDSYNSPNNDRGYGLPTFSRIAGITGNVLASVNKIIVFPNPFTNNTIHIKIPDDFTSESIEFLIYNTKGKVIGKKIVTQPISNKVIDVNIKSKANGLYFLTINSDSFTKTIKLIKY